MRGEFIRGDGLVLPNNVTQAGAGRILDMAFRDDSPNKQPFILGLCDAVYQPLILRSQSNIPIGRGYDEQPLPRTVSAWPTLAQVNGEFFIESAPVIFTATAAYTTPVTRCWLGASGIDAMFALSSPLPAPLLITPTTPEPDRTFRYRLYLR